MQPLTSRRVRSAALAASLALHGGILLALAVVPVTNGASTAGSDAVVVLSWTRTAPAEAEVAASTPLRPEVIPPPVQERMETIAFVDAESGDSPVVAETPQAAPRAERPMPDLYDVRDVRGP